MFQRFASTGQDKVAEIAKYGIHNTVREHVTYPTNNPVRSATLDIKPSLELTLSQSALILKFDVTMLPLQV